MAEWSIVRFTDLASRDRWAFSIGPFGSKVTTRDYLERGVPFIRGVNLSRGVFYDDDFVFISEEKVGEIESAVVRSGDLVFTRKGTIGQVSMIPRNASFNRYLISGSQVKARLDEKVAHAEFYFYWFLSPFGQQTLLAHTVTTGVPSLANSLTTLRNLEVPCPPLSVQKAIAQVLGALDDKIAANERIAATAGELSRAKMKALWRSLGVASLTVDPGFPESDVRRTTLAEMCAEHGGGIQTGPFGSQLHASDYVESGTPSVMPQNIGDNIIIEDGIARVASGDVERLSKYVLSAGDIVYSRRGDVKRRALVREYESGWLCGTGCLRVRLGNSSKSLFMSQYLGEPEVQDWILQHSVGATMPNLNTSILGAVPVVLPSPQVVDRISVELAPIDARSTQGMHESRTLTALRDTLLPNLMSGKLRVRDAERIVEDAV
jgi:type I restriction enzyme S subunit